MLSGQANNSVSGRESPGRESFRSSGFSMVSRLSGRHSERKLVVWPEMMPQEGHS
jgi:hypothetical protein